MADSFDLGALIGEFRDEARDQIDRIDAGLLELEREGSLDDDARSALLRTLHTLKGNAGMLGLSQIQDYVHVMENVLRAEDRAWSEGELERLFEGAASLRTAVEAAGEDHQAAAFGELAAARHRLEELEAEPGPSTTSMRAPDEVETRGTGELIRIPFAKLDTLLAEVGELMGDARALEEELGRSARGELRTRSDAIGRRAETLREAVMSLRLVPVGRILGRFHGLVRRLARQQGKEARLVVEGEATELDKSTADALAEPLLHLIRNAIDHGIREPGVREAAGRERYGTIRIRAEQVGDRVRIEVEDDGVGLDMSRIRKRAVEAGLTEEGEDLTDEELTALVFHPGFSTRSDVSTVSGRGVGLDVVARSIQELRGDLSIERPAHGGTRFVLHLPLTVAVIPSLVFEAAGEVLALPTAYVARTLRVARTERVGAAEVVRHEDEIFPVADPHRLFGWPAAERGSFGVLVRQGGRGAVLTAERLVDQRDLVVKAMPSFGGSAPAVSGGSVLPGGRVVLVLDPGEVIRLNDKTHTRGSGAGST